MSHDLSTIESCPYRPLEATSARELSVRSARSGQGGLGMIELIVAVGFITVGILGLNSLAIVAVRGNLSSRLIDQATRLAQAKIEQVKSAGYAAAAIGTTVESNLTPTGTPVAKTIATANSPAGISNAGGLFTRTTVIAAGGVGPTRTVSVSMQWNDHATQQTTFFTEIVGP